MKTSNLIAILGALACVAVVNGAAYGNPAQTDDILQINLGTALKMYYKALQSIMPCGLESMQMPILAPLTSKSFNFNVDNNNNRISANFTDLYVTGLNTAEMVKFDYDDATGVLSYDINMPKIQVLGEYSLDAQLSIAGLDVKVGGEGLLNMKITDYRVVGQLKLAPNAQNYLAISDDVIELFVGDVAFNNWNRKWDNAINNYYNEFMRNYVLMMVQQLRPALTPLFNKYVLPMENEVLSSITADQFVNVLMDVTEQMNSAHCNAN